MEDQESLETSAVIGQLPNMIKNQVDKLLADAVVPAGVVIGGVLLAGDHLQVTCELWEFPVSDLELLTATHEGAEKPNGDLSCLSSYFDTTFLVVVAVMTEPTYITNSVQYMMGTSLLFYFLPNTDGENL